MEEISPIDQIGVAIITYKRPDYYKTVLSSLPKDKIGHIVVVNDGEMTYVQDSDADVVVKNGCQLGVAKSKNIAVKALLDRNCEHIFIIEDDIVVKDPNVFQVYIKAAQSTGIHHLCYEKVANNDKTLKYTHETPDGTKIGFYHNPQGAFMYTNANVFKKLGVFDEGYMNAFEHIDFEYMLSVNNVAPPFWYFPDLLDSNLYLTDIEGSSENSSITNKEKYKENVDISAKHFIQKWGHFTSDIQDVGPKELKSRLLFLENTYSRKKMVNKDKSLCVIIPYRDRKPALNELIPALKRVLSKQVAKYTLIVAEQNDDHLFNKGLLNNLAFLINSGHDYYCFHDVDLIPEIADYSYPQNPVHMSTFCSQFNYIENPDATMGGVIVFRKEQFEAANGYPNDFVGWGSEDNTLAIRVEKAGMKIYRHPFGKFYSVPHPVRITNKVEMDAHYVNGQKREDEKSGKRNMWDNGLNTINLNDYAVELNSEKDYLHYKISKKHE